MEGTVKNGPYNEPHCALGTTAILGKETSRGNRFSDYIVEGAKKMFTHYGLVCRKCG